MFKKFKAWLKTRDATTLCEVVPGDKMHLSSTCLIERSFNIEGELLQRLYDTSYEFTWEVTRPYRTHADAMVACIDTLNLEHVQEQDWI